MTDPDRLARDYPDRPWVGVGIVVLRGDRVLLVKRGRPPRLGEWGLPGGAQKLGETLVETARREVYEETGLEIASPRVLTALDAITHAPDGRVQYHYTLVEIVAGCAEGEPVAADDVLDARWATLDEVERLVAWDATRHLIRMALSANGWGETGESR